MQLSRPLHILPKVWASLESHRNAEQGKWDWKPLASTLLKVSIGKLWELQREEEPLNC